MPNTRSRVRQNKGQLVEANPEIERSVRQSKRRQRLKDKADLEPEKAPETEEMADQVNPRNPQDPQTSEVAQRQPEIRQHEVRMRDRAIPNAEDFRSSIAEPEVTVQNFELKPGLIQMVQQSQFGGSPMENPNVHLQKFLQMSNTVKMNGVSQDIIRLQLFPFSLRDKATEWLMSMPPNHFTCWDELSKAFLARYFPPSKTAKIRHELNTFTQRDGESLYEAWERNKDLQRQCPHHGLPDWLVLENFYNGLDQSIRSALDSAAGGSLMGKSDVQAKQLIEEMALHNYQYGNPRGRNRGMFEVETMQMLTAKFDQLSHQLLNRMDNMQVNQVSSSNPSCGACGMYGHQSSECLQYGRDTSVEEVNAFNARGAGNPYPNNFNFSWRNPANFTPSSSNFQSQPYQNQTRPPGFQAQVSNQSYQPPVHMTAPQKSRTEELLEQMLVSQQKRDVEIDQKFQQSEQRVQQLFNKFDQMQAHNRMLESQVAQLSTGQPQRNYSKLPSQPEANPRERVNAVTLRSGKQLESREQEKAKESDSEQAETSTPEVSKGEHSNRTVDVGKENIENPYVPPPPYQPPLPFPQRIQKANLEKQYGRFLANLQKLSINVPFLEALSQMPSYAKFLKELLSNKRNLGELETVALTKVSSNSLQNKLPQKLQDPGSFSIPCYIGNYEVRKALCDPGASVSLIPLSICKKLDMGHPKPTTMALQMADQSIKYPVGIVEDVPLKVGKFFIPVDFVVLDMEEDVQTPIILGRPFLATAGAIIDMKGGRLTFRIGDETAEFNVFPASKFPVTSDSCFCVDDFDRLLDMKHGGEQVDDPMEACITGSVSEFEEISMCTQLLDHTPVLKGPIGKGSILHLSPPQDD